MYRGHLPLYFQLFLLGHDLIPSGNNKRKETRISACILDKIRKCYSERRCQYEIYAPLQDKEAGKSLSVGKGLYMFPLQDKRAANLLRNGVAP